MESFATWNILLETNCHTPGSFQHPMRFVKEHFWVRQKVKSLEIWPRPTVAVAYQTIFTPLAGRPLDKPDNGRSLRGGGLCL